MKKNYIVFVMIGLLMLMVSCFWGPHFMVRIENPYPENGEVRFKEGDWTDQATKTVLERQTVELYAEAATGYSFNGWYEAGEQVSDETPLSITVEQDRHLTAMFSELTQIPIPSGKIENITQQKRYSNVNIALNEAQDGDIIEVEGGTVIDDSNEEAKFTEELFIDDDITLRSDNGASFTIDMAGQGLVDAIHVKRARVVIEDVVVKNVELDSLPIAGERSNQTGMGCGIFFDDAVATLSHSQVSNNETAGIKVIGPENHVEIINSTITANKCEGLEIFPGELLYTYGRGLDIQRGATVGLTDVVIYNNDSFISGGGIYVNNSTLITRDGVVVRNNDVVDNEAGFDDSNTYAGGIQVMEDSTLKVSDSTEWSSEFHPGMGMLYAAFSVDSSGEKHVPPVESHPIVVKNNIASGVEDTSEFYW